MIPAAFDYERAGTLEEAVSLLSEHGEDAKLIAGGHSLLPLMKLRLARPSVLVDIDGLTGLSYVHANGGGTGFTMGALTRIHHMVSDETLLAVCPILAHAAGQVGDPQVRHRATVGGSVAHADPAGDLPTVLLALDAEFAVQGPRGERVIGAGDFFKSLFETDLRPDEVLTEIRAGAGGFDGWSYVKFHRRAIDWAVVGVAALVRRQDGRIAEARIGLTNMGLTPLRATAVEEALAGAEPTPEAVAAAAEHAPDGTSPPEDTNGSAEYRRELSKVLVRRALMEALSR